MIKLYMSAKRIHARTRDWHPGLKDQFKSIPGARWAPSFNSWTYPLSMATLRALRAEFGQDLWAEESLMEWARAERRREKRAKGYAVHHDAAISRVAAISPVLAEAMGSRTYQRSAARFSSVAGNILLADEPGLGKTASLFASLMESGVWKGTHLVVAPKVSLHATWARQVQEWTPAEAWPMPDGAAKRRKTWDEFLASEAESKFLLINPAMLRRQYQHLCKKCNIWEEDVKAKKASWPIEHHIQKGHTARRTIRIDTWPEIISHNWSSITIDESQDVLAAYRPANVTQMMQGLLDIRKDAKLTALSGTPLHGQEKNVWGTLDWLGVNTGGYWPFMESYMEIRKGFFGDDVLGLDPSCKTEFYQLLDRHVLRRTRPEVRPELPLGQRVDITVEMSAKHERQYREFESDGEVEIDGGTLSGQGLLSEMTRLRQMAWGVWQNDGVKPKPTLDSAKWEWLLEFLASRGITGKAASSWLPEKGTAYKYVIGSQFTEILDLLESALVAKGIPAMKITGDVSSKRRQEVQRIFQSNDTKHRIVLIQTLTGGVSIDLDAWCDEMVILDETFVADQQTQLEGRINNRSGRVSPRMWYYVRTAGTIEQRLAENNYGQHDLQHKLLDGRRGVKLALHLIRGDK